MQEQLPGLSIPTDERSMVEVLREIAALTRSQLINIRTEKARGVVTENQGVDRDYIGDFASEDYLTKNIRVMPMPQPYIDAQSAHTSQYYASGMGGAQGAVDSD